MTALDGFQRPADLERALARGMKRQLERLERALSDGAPRAGWKVAINTPDSQRQIGLPAPVAGWIAGDRVMPSGAQLPLRGRTLLLAEAELAIRVASDVDPAASDPAIDCVAPAVEIVDQSLPAHDLETLLEHSVFHEATLLGDTHPAGAPAGLGVDWPLVYRNAKLRRRPEAGLVPDAPAAIVRQVAAFLAPYGARVRAGEWILSGSYTAPILLRPGDELRVEFGGLGTVEAAFPATPDAEGPTAC